MRQKPLAKRPPARALPPLAVLAALLSGCAPQFKTFYFSQSEWRGTELSPRGRIVAADAVAGAAPNTTTLIEIGGLLAEPPDPGRRVRVQSARARGAIAALERSGIAAADIGVEAVPPGFEAEPPASLLDKRMVVVVHY